MAINFPDSPTIGDEFTGGGFTWTWNGSSWEKVVSSSSDVGFVVDMGNATQYTTTFDQAFPAGGYDIYLSESDATFDIYGLGADGELVGYTSSAKVIFSSPVQTVVIYDSVPNQIYSFVYNGPSETPATSGNAPGAAAYLVSGTPASMSDIDDTTTVTGGNFANNVEVYFELGETVLPAKNVTVNSTTEIIVTRPDDMVGLPNLYTMRVVNPGVPQPTASNLNLLVDYFDGGIKVPNSVEYLILGGGGGGGRSGGGGGGGEAVSGTWTSATYGALETVEVGAGGGGSNDYATTGSAGSNSTFLSLSAGGGGGGGSHKISTFAAPSSGTGGGGGGSAGGGTGYYSLGAASSGTGGDGGDGFFTDTYNDQMGAGGGGATADGANATDSAGGNGGSGVLSLDGNYKAGGGGGGGLAWAGHPAGTGIDGGANGGSDRYGSGGTAAAGSAGGGGGGCWFAPNNDGQIGGSGGSGAVQLKYADSFSEITNIGPGLTYTYSVSGGYRIYTFTAGLDTIGW